MQHRRLYEVTDCVGKHWTYLNEDDFRNKCEWSLPIVAHFKFGRGSAENLSVEFLFSHYDDSNIKKPHYAWTNF